LKRLDSRFRGNDILGALNMVHLKKKRQEPRYHLLKQTRPLPMVFSCIYVYLFSRFFRASSCCIMR
jgi:hypothetical protein